MTRGRPRRLVGRRPAVLLAAIALAASGASPAAAMSAGASAARSGTSLPVIERQVMCVTCKIPLNVAQSPQADRERAFIQGLINQGENEAQIKRTLVAQYGPAVLALPSTHGFDLAAYIVPLAALLGLLVALALLLPRWRRHGRARMSGEARPPALSATDAARLDADLARFD
jgi:cytochrome c-type biogenesis protein CcmH